MENSHGDTLTVVTPPGIGLNGGSSISKFIYWRLATSSNHSTVHLDMEYVQFHFGWSNRQLCYGKLAETLGRSKSSKCWVASKCEWSLDHYSDLPIPGLDMFIMFIRHQENPIAFEDHPFYIISAVQIWEIKGSCMMQGKALSYWDPLNMQKNPQRDMTRC